MSSAVWANCQSCSPATRWGLRRSGLSVILCRYRDVARLAGSLLVLGSTLTLALRADSLVLSPERAVSFALERSLVLKAARLNPQIASLGVRAADAAWSPQVFARSHAGGIRTPPQTAFHPQSGLTSRQFTSQVGIDQLLPWGASYSLEWDTGRLSSDSPILLVNPQRSTNASVTYTQHLLRGFRVDEARANRLISIKGQVISEAGLQRSGAATTRAVLQAYWNWVYLRELLAVERQSLGRSNWRRICFAAIGSVRLWGKLPKSISSRLKRKWRGGPM